MPEKPNPRLRLIVLFAAGAVLVAALFGALQAFNTSHITFLNPDTSGETLAFFGLTVVLFLLLIALLMLLLRNLLKLSADQGNALGARLRTRMVLGAALIAVTPATFMFLFSFFLMNRTIDRWFSPNTTELRDDSVRVVRELAQYVAGNARTEASSIAASGAPDSDAMALQPVLASHRVTLQGGFVVIYSPGHRVLSTFEAPPDTTSASLITWLPKGTEDTEDAPAVPFQGSLYKNLLDVAQRNDIAVLHIGAQDYALGMASTGAGAIVLAALPMPQGLSQTTARIRSGATSYWQLFRARKELRSNFILLLLVVTVFVFFSGVWLALFLSKQITRPVAALADAMNAIAAGSYEQRVELLTTGEMAELVRSFNHMAADLETSRQRAATSSAQFTRANQALEERRREAFEIILQTMSKQRRPLSTAAPASCSRPIALSLHSSARVKMTICAASASRLSFPRSASTRSPPSFAAVSVWAPPPPNLSPMSAAAPCICPSPARASTSPPANRAPSLCLKTPANCFACSGSWPGKKSRSASPTRSRIL